MQRLAGAHEHLDGELTDAGTLAGNLRDLARVNRWLGGLRLSARAIDRLLAARTGPDGVEREGPIRILDVGTGAADIPVGLLRGWRRRRGGGRGLEVTAADSRPEIIAIAKHLRAVRAEPGLTLVVADGFDLPFEDGAFDIAHASLLLHHLEPDDAVRLLRELRRVATLGVVVNDLQRGWIPWLAARALFRIVTTNRFTREDGPLSVRRAYRAAEARVLATRAGLRVIGEEHVVLGFRWALVAVPE